MVMDRFAELPNRVDKARTLTKEEKLKSLVDSVARAEQDIKNAKQRLKEEFGFEHIADANKKLHELAELRTKLNEWS